MDISEIAAGIGASDALANVAGKIGVDPSQAQAMLQGVLEHVNAGGSLEGMAEGVASKVGLDPGQVSQFLPSVIGLLQGHSENATAGVQGVLGGIMQALQGGSVNSLLAGLDANKDGSIADEAIGLVQGLLGRKST